MNLNENFSKKLKLIREELDLTQEQMSEKLQIERSTLTKIELGQRAVTLNQVKDYSEKLNESPAILLGLTEGSHQISSTSGSFYLQGINSNITLNVGAEIIDEIKKILKK